ncbi:MAG TPA: hypothetical protein VEB03_00305 [Candidatus Nanoarchaeia archaeon]|nr:hypothetical protein [Candidatus Nanoarchaeia archaeon]
MDASIRSTLSRLAALTGAVLLLASGLAAAKKPTLEDTGRQSIRPSTRLAVTFCEVSCSTSFSVRKTRDVFIRTNWFGLKAGAHEQKTVLTLPDGSVYQSFTAKFTSLKKGATVEHVLPVAGSWIHQRGLKGEWKASIYLDGELARTATLKFTE